MKSVRAKLIEFSQIDYIQEEGKKREKIFVLNASYVQKYLYK